MAPAPSINAFKNRLNKFWIDIPIMYNPTCQYDSQNTCSIANEFKWTLENQTVLYHFLWKSVTVNQLLKKEKVLSINFHKMTKLYKFNDLTSWSGCCQYHDRYNNTVAPHQHLPHDPLLSQEHSFLPDVQADQTPWQSLLSSFSSSLSV